MKPQVLEPGDPLHNACCTIVERAKAEVDALLRKNWLTVKRVVGAFRKRDQLTQAELDQVIAHGPTLY